jgi:hypothetical protein
MQDTVKEAVTNCVCVCLFVYILQLEVGFIVIYFNDEYLSQDKNT